MGLLQRIFQRQAVEERASQTPALPVRDPALARVLGLGMGTAAGVNITCDNARECPEVDACISLIEDTIGTLPLDLYERIDADTRQRVSDHPLHVLVHDRPNSWQSAAEFRTMLEGWRNTHGNGYAHITLDSRGVMPASLEPIHPNEMRPFRRDNGDVAYEYTPPTGRSKILLQHEVFHVRDKTFSRNLIKGDSRVERHRETIARAKATSEYMARFFSNNAVPKSFLVTKEGQKLDQAQQDQLRDQFERKHAGVENAHKIGVLQGGLDLKTLGISNTDAQMIEAYQLAVVQISRIWGIPLHLINELSKSTSFGTGLEQQSIGFIVYFIRPKFVFWEQALNRALLTSDQQRRFYFEFNPDGLLRGDFKTRMDGYAILIQWGLMTINEVRRLMNLPPVEGGDERMHPLNMVPASQIMAVLLKDNAKSQQTKP